MKGVRMFAIIVAGFVGLIVLMSLLGKRNYEWTPTFSTADDEPFGCKFFDQMIAHSMGQRYQVDGDPATLDELCDEHGDVPQGWLFLDYTLSLSPNESSRLLQLARRGDCVMVCAANFGHCLVDSLGVWQFGTMFDSDDMEDFMQLYSYKNSIVWTGKSDRYEPEEFLISEALHIREIHYEKDSLDYEILASNKDDENDSIANAVAVEIPMGCGRIILVSTPLLFTNNGVLSDDGCQYVFRLLSCFDQMPVRRVALATHSQTRQEDSLAMLDYIRRQPPLWWAWCLMLLLVVLFMLTNARRRQRPIPVVAPPQNHSLEFVRLIGTLYSQQGYHADLIAKKWQYTAEQLRRQLHVDITNPQEDRQTAAVIAQNSGLSADEIVQTLCDVRQVLEGRGGVTAQLMHGCIDRLNALLASP